MNIWPPPPQKNKQAITTVGNRRFSPQPIINIALGILVGLLGGMVISVLIWLAKSALGRHYSYFTLNGSLYLLAIPLEIGMGCVLFSKSKAFAFSFTLTAICVSIVLGAIGTVLDSFPELD